MAKHTCPMHPEVVREGPGTCPTCGMALEPAIVQLEEGESAELVDMRKRLGVSAVLTVPLVLFAMGEMVPGLSGALALGGARPWIELALAAPVTLWGGLPFFQRAGASITNKSPNMFTLVAIGAGASFALSVVATLAPGVFPDAFREAHGEVPVYFEASASIVTLVLLGQVLELAARKRTTGALRALLSLSPKASRRLVAPGKGAGNDAAETEESVPPAELSPGDRVRVLPGERVPADGRVVSGTSTCDESMMTGEAAPVPKKAGDTLTAGTLNGQGALVMQVDRTGDDTVLARIVDMVSAAQRSRVPIQRLVDRVSAVFVPAVVVVAIATFAAWMAFGSGHSFAPAVLSSVAVLIIACPCALGLATPMSIMVAAGRGASMGVLVRNAAALERLEKIDTVVLDKTGTVTFGRPKVETVETASGKSKEQVLRLAAALEKQSEHPLARAIVDAASGPIEEAFGVQVSPGEGVTGYVDGRSVAVGGARLVHKLSAKGAEGPVSERIASPHTSAFVIEDGVVVGVVGLSDVIKPSSKSAARALKEAGLTLILITGDSERTARAVAADIGVENVRAGLSPSGKAEAIRAMRKEGHIVAMAGDGINDAPGLAEADVGIAMGTGADVAMEAAAVTLVSGDLGGIARAQRLAKATMKNIRQNLWFSFAYNALGIPIAAGVLYPLLHVTLSPMLAAAAMSLSSVSVIANALRLRTDPL